MFKDPSREPSTSELLLPGDPGFALEAAALLLSGVGSSVLTDGRAHLDRNPDEPFFSERDRWDIFQAVKAGVEYADDQNASAVVFIDKSARPMWVGFKELWQATHSEDKPVPNIFFVEPDGFREMRWKEVAAINEKMETDHPFLSKHKKDTVLVMDTCIHDGVIAGGVLDVMNDCGFEDVRFAVVSETKNVSHINPDEVLLDEAPQFSCYPFGRVGFVTEPDHNKDHLYSKRWHKSERNSFRIKKLRDEIRAIVRDYLEDETA